MKRCYRSSLFPLKLSDFLLRIVRKHFHHYVCFGHLHQNVTMVRIFLDLTAPFAEIVSAMVSGDGHVDFMDQASIPFLTSGTYLARAFLIDLIALSSDKKGLKCRLRVSFDTLRQRKRPQASPSITAQDRHCNKEVIDSG